MIVHLISIPDCDAVAQLNTSREGDVVSLDLDEGVACSNMVGGSGDISF